MSTQKNEFSTRSDTVYTRQPVKISEKTNPFSEDDFSYSDNATLPDLRDFFPTKALGFCGKKVNIELKFD